MEKMLFIRIPKNASTSIYFDNKLNIYRNPIVQKHGTYKEILNTLKLKTKPFSFCVCRNPYSRFISLYFYLKKSIDKGLVFDDDPWVLPIKKMSFSSFCKYISKIGTDTARIIIPQSSFVYDENNNFAIDFIIKYENLIEDWYKFTKKAKLKTFTNIRKDNQTSHLNHEFYYNKKLKSVVYELYKEDFELFGYNK